MSKQTDSKPEPDIDSTLKEIIPYTPIPKITTIDKTEVKVDEKLERYEELKLKNKSIIENIEDKLFKTKEEVAMILINEAKKHRSGMKEKLKSIQEHDKEAIENYFDVRREFLKNHQQWRIRLTYLLNNDKGDLKSNLSKIIHWDSSVLTTSGWNNNQVDKNEIKIIEKVGEGSFGKVYRGIVYGNIVAIKELKDIKNQSLVISLQNEQKILSELKHKNILKFMGCSIEHPEKDKPGYYALLTELAEHGSLQDIIYPTKDKSVPNFLSHRIKMQIIGEIVEGMNYLHTHDPKIIHLDLKCANILLDSEYHVRIADFGMSRIMFSNFSLGVIGGTPYYMAPEILKSLSSGNILNQKEISEKCDVYSFGILINELLSGQKPYTGGLMNSKETFHSNTLPNIDELVNIVVKEENRPKIGNDNFPLTKNIKQFIKNCWSTKPTDRPFFGDMLKKKEWKISVLNHSAGGDQKSIDFLKKFKKENISFKEFLKKLTSHYEIEDKYEENDSGNPYIVAFKTILGIGNTETITKDKLNRFATWTKGVNNGSELLKMIYFIFNKPWFWGPYKFEGDINSVKAALSSKSNKSRGTYLVFWEEEAFFLGYVKKDMKNNKKILQIDKQKLNSTSILNLNKEIEKKKFDLKLKEPANDKPPEIRAMKLKDGFIVAASSLYSWNNSGVSGRLDTNSHSTHFNYIV